MKKHFYVAGIVTLVTSVFFTIHQADAVVPIDAPLPTDLYGSPLRDGDLISAGASANDPDIFIIKLLTHNSDQRSNEVHGYKRLFLNPAIFSMYAHLGGFSNVRPVSTATRDSFGTSGLFRNCETGDQAVLATEVTGEDSGILHHVQMSGEQAFAEDRYFFSKVFCINSREQAFYPLSANPYTRLSDIPNYNRTPIPLRMISPNGGETFVAGQTDPQVFISWTGTCASGDPLTFVDLYAGGVFVQRLLNGAPQGNCIPGDIQSSTTLWEVSAGLAQGTNYKIRVNFNNAFDESDAPFTITNSN